MSGAVIILGKMCICKYFLVIHGRWSVATCVDYIFLPYSILSLMLFDIVTWDIVSVDLFDIYMFTSESVIANLYFLVEFGMVPILLIKLI